MDISFASRKLEKQLSDEAQIRRAFGDRGRRFMELGQGGTAGRLFALTQSCSVKLG